MLNAKVPGQNPHLKIETVNQNSQSMNLARQH